jgi:amino acid transporter
VITQEARTDEGSNAETVNERDSSFAPKAKAHLVAVPEPLGYRIKNRLLGPPLHNERLAHERLGKPTALAVFASDNLSSSAYATEEILRVLIPVVGIAAFSLVVPITVALLLVLGLLILSYRQTIKAYPSAGGAYIVTRDNFGLLPAQVAGVALLTDYILTVSVSVAAGSAALASAFPSLAPWTMPIAVAFVVIIAAGNLKGVRESGKLFALPTYFFIANMVLLLAVGFYRMTVGGIPHAEAAEGALAFGEPGTNAMFYGAGMWIVLKAYASGGAAVTGVEAISNGVPAFKEPAWKNARSTLVVMGSLLGFMFLGLSVLATQVHPIPYEAGNPTVISQIANYVYGADTSGLGRALFLSMQAGTMLILVLAANTSFADFPRLASFHAEDNFMPRQLTKRGHRLVFSNGIISLAIAGIFLLVITNAQVDRLIPLYAIGVFLSFTLSQAGMAKHHVTHKEPRWRTGLVINGSGALISAIVCTVIAVTKFTGGAWAIIILVPVLVAALMRLNRQYLAEGEVLERDAHQAVTAPAFTRPVVIVLVDSLDMASARAIQYARSLNPDDVRVVHFDLDPIRTHDLVNAWVRLGFDRLTLDVVDCPDRRLEQGTALVVARELLNPGTDVSVLIPRRDYSRFWHRLVHDHSADSIAKALEGIPHCNITIVPFHLDAMAHELPVLAAPAGGGPSPIESTAVRKKKNGTPAANDLGDFELPTDRTPLEQLTFRQRARVAGKVYSLRVQPSSGVATLELTIIDDTGALVVVFFGRRQLAGVNAGTRLIVDGVVGEHHGTMAMLNPVYEIKLPSHPHEPLPQHG